jgi:predicted ATPase
MFRKLTLENFKNFRQAELELGPFTVLIGANASGKSNLREAFRFLNGISRGYTLPEIIGEKFVSGERVWSGIRGGSNELSYKGSETFLIQSDLIVQGKLCNYMIEVQSGLQFPQITKESLYRDNQRLFEANPPKLSTLGYSIAQLGSISNFQFPLATLYKPLLTRIKTDNISIDIGGFLSEEFAPQLKDATVKSIREDFNSIIQTNTINREMLEQKYNFTEQQFATLEKDITVRKDLKIFGNEVIEKLQSMRFFEFIPDAMRESSFPGQTTLGDRGENLSSVLQAICDDKKEKQILLDYLEDLTPMEIIDLEFPTDQIGRVLVTLVEKSGQRVSAYSASDGTLRILAMLAAFLGPITDGFYFFEELENGIHPARLYLLTRLIEEQTKKRDIQVVATTHSPHLLNFLQPKTLENASLLYRLEGDTDAHIKRIMDIPDAKRLIEEQGILRLHESGWFENTMFFLDDDEEAEPEAEAVA